MGLRRAGHDWATFTSHADRRSSLVAQVVKNPLQCRRPGFGPLAGEIPWRRTWQPTPVFLPGESHGQRCLVGCNPQGCKELNSAEWLSTSTYWPHWCSSQQTVISRNLDLNYVTSQLLTVGRLGSSLESVLRETQGCYQSCMASQGIHVFSVSVRVCGGGARLLAGIMCLNV